MSWHVVPGSRARRPEGTWSKVGRAEARVHDNEGYVLTDSEKCKRDERNIEDLYVNNNEPQE